MKPIGKSLRGSVFLLFVFLSVFSAGKSWSHDWVYGPNGEIIVGLVDPNEKATITSETFTTFTDIFIVNNGSLTVTTATLNIAGNITLTDNASLIFNDSVLKILNAQDFQYFVKSADNTIVHFDNTTVWTNTYSSHFYTQNNSQLTIENSALSDSQYAWIINYVIDDATLAVTNSDFPNEIVPEDRSIIHVDNSMLEFKSIAIWVNYPYNVQAEITGLKAPTERSTVSLLPSDPKITGMENKIVVTDSNINWMINPGFFTEITLIDSAVTFVLFLSGYNGKDFAHLQPGYFADGVIPLLDFDRSISMKNSSVIFWQLYLDGVGNEWSETYRIQHSELNEVIIFDKTFTRITNCILGPAVLGTLYTGEVAVKDSILRTLRVTAYHDSRITLENCRLEGSPVTAYNNTVIQLKNVELAPNTENSLMPMNNKVSFEAIDSGRIYVVAINPIERRYDLGESIDITGTAKLFKGEDSLVDFKKYYLEYSLRDEDSWTTIGVASTQQVTTGTLTTWNTSDLTENGVYLIKLVMTDTAGDTLYSLGKARIGILPTAILPNRWILYK